MAAVVMSLAGYFIGARLLNSPLPNAPCSIEISNGDFINDQYQKYRFNGAMTLWLKSKMITIFGIYETNGSKKQLNRSMLLDSIQSQSNVLTANVKSTHVGPGDQMREVGNFFAAKDQSLVFHFQKIKRGEYLVMINNNWVFLCKEH